MLRTLEIREDLCRGALPRLRRYAGAVSTEQDVILMSCLKTAIVEIQDHSGRSFSPCSMRLDISSNESPEVRLYGDGIKVTAVRDGKGVEVPYAMRGDNVLDTSPYVHDVLVIDYETTPEKWEKARLEPLVMQYATALYDGQAEELGRILAQC